ncbi:Transposable element Tcb2 transposase [Amphibalanus amphitrite]|uniref:Transposable element Tcb2 transposase n=1 Tax=Amphibalanus amphitrite TaxID=1232801 RepID=A0A6A4WQJ8_AMPAM|nr:Transposable element Tcb2 transposase [Amphibalanus amphitrite]KAF0304331.1 Transposable element Tcb2 transposase [Amphibalanus amphitrite]
MARRPKTGRPRKTTAEQDAAMVAVAKQQPFMPLRDVATSAGAELHPSLVTNRLKKAGLYTFKPCGKLRLLERHKAARLAFATESLQRYDPDFWKNVIFTDEKIFRTDSEGRVRVRRPRGARYEDQYMQAWDSLRANTEMFAALSGSMVKRLQSVVDAAGGMTKY